MSIQWNYKIQLKNTEIFEKIENDNGIKVPNVQRTKSCICTTYKLPAFKHFCELFLQRDGSCLFVIRTGSDAHGKRDAVSIHKQPHLHKRGRLVLL